MSESFVAVEDLEDPRSSINRLHPPVSVLSIALLAVLCGADGPTSIRGWAAARQQFLERFLELPDGLPSRDVFRRVLCGLQPAASQPYFNVWIEAMGAIIADQTTTEGTESEKRHLAIDGKTLKGSRNDSKARGPLHVVSVWMSAKGITLAQVPTDAKSNEITAIPQVLELIDVRGSVITIDAMGAQVGIVRAITERGGDVIVCLKGNQGNLHKAVSEFVEKQLENDFDGLVHESLCESLKKNRHRREESMTCIQFEIPKDFPLEEKWVGLKSVGVVVRESSSGDKHTVERSFYISSLPIGIVQFAKPIRNHWGIENTCHWSLDVTWREDSLRTMERRMAENLAWIQRFSLSLLKQIPDKLSVAMRRRMCGWSEEYLTQVLIKLGT
ncbi:MAG: ISAs1 family transposase [Planctomycetaceae bacterium]